MAFKGKGNTGLDFALAIGAIFLIFGGIPLLVLKTSKKEPPPKPPLKHG